MNARVSLAASAGILAAGLLFGRPAAVAPAPGTESLAGRTNGRTRLRFEDGRASSGISFVHEAGRTRDRFFPEVMGAGLAVADFDRDGSPDLYFVNSGRVFGSPRTGGDRLYLNDGKGRFRDASRAWGLPSAGYGMGVAVGDFDGDGWIDVFRTGYGGAEMLLRNDGGRRFLDATGASGIRPDGGWSTSAGFFDADGDGDLDLWIVRYVKYDRATALPCTVNLVRVYCTPEVFEGESSRLLRNDGGGKFTDVTAESGVGAAKGKGLALLLSDIDGDGRPDAYVANDTTQAFLFMNKGGMRFREEALAAGVALDEMGTAMSGMGADATDVDGDGRLDLAVTDFQGRVTALFLQDLPLVFRDASDALGIGGPSRRRLKFGIDFFDADNDGDEDLIVANGHIHDNPGELRTRAYSFEQPNTLYENTGGRFRDVTEEAGPALKKSFVSRGLVTADLDGDLRLDYVVSNNGGPAEVGRNATRAGNAVILWLEGTKANRSAIGARIEARAGGRRILREIRGSSSYLSVPDLRVHVGTGSAAVVDELVVDWPGSGRQTLKALKAGRFYHVVEGREPEPFTPGKRIIPPAP